MRNSDAETKTGAFSVRGPDRLVRTKGTCVLPKGPGADCRLYTETGTNANANTFSPLRLTREAQQAYVHHGAPSTDHKFNADLRAVTHFDAQLYTYARIHVSARLRKISRAHRPAQRYKYDSRSLQCPLPRLTRRGPQSMCPPEGHVTDKDTHGYTHIHIFTHLQSYAQISLYFTYKDRN